jgi:predicted Zn-dependent protease
MRAVAMLAFACAAPPSVRAQLPVDTAREVGRANALVQAGKAEEAIPTYRKLAATLPHEPSLKLNLAIALYKTGRYGETASECEGLVKTEPSLFPAWLFLGAARSKLGDAAGAEEPLRKALALKPDDPNARIMLADVLATTRKRTEAVLQYSEAAERMPALPRAWYGLGYSYALLVRDSLTRLQEQAPNSAEALALSGDLDLEAAQVAKAFVHFRQALRLRPGFTGLHAKVADVYLAAGHADWAATERRKEEYKGERSCVAVSQLECEIAAGRLEQAASARVSSLQDTYWQAQAFLELSHRAYTKLSALPASQEGYEAEARREENRGRYPQAVAAWQKALQLDPANEELQRGLVLAQCHSNDCVSALPLLKQELAKHRSSAEWNYLYGLSLVTVREPLQAISHLQKALRLDPAFAAARGVLGEAYLEAGRPQEAIPNLKAALSGDQSGSRYYQLAQAYRAAGNEAQARDMLRRYREIVQRATGQDTAMSAITPP